VALPSAQVGPRGLPFDREWMVVDARGAFVTQRTRGELARVATAFEADLLRLDAPGLPPLRLPLAVDAAARSVAVRVWRWSGPALDAGAEAAAWFASLLGLPCRLVRRHPDVPRPAGSHAPGGTVGFADAYPVLACTEASLADLNARLALPVTMGAFRPNLVVTGGEPWSEDGWGSLQVGRARLQNVKPCARCVIPTRDPDTGEARGPEPLRTLNALRPGPDGPTFGVNLAVEQPGEVAVGDDVRIFASS
jgi:uncharacterized protein YcbX